MLRRKPPRPFADGVIVPILHPYSVLTRMSAITPPPQLAPYLKVHARERTFSNTVPMIVRPSPYDGVELNDQIFLVADLFFSMIPRIFVRAA